MLVPAFWGLPSLYFTICFHCTIVPIIAMYMHVRTYMYIYVHRTLGEQPPPKLYLWKHEVHVHVTNIMHGWLESIQVHEGLELNWPTTVLPMFGALHTNTHIHTCHIYIRPSNNGSPFQLWTANQKQLKERFYWTRYIPPPHLIADTQM